MAHLQGGKFTSSHTTVIPLVYTLGLEISAYPEVTKITLGKMSSSRRRTGTWKVKIIDESGCVLIRVTQSTSFQEFRVFSNNTQETKIKLARYVRDNNWELRFGSLIETTG